MTAQTLDRAPIVYEYTRLSRDPQGLRADHVSQNRSLANVRARHGLPVAARSYTDDDRSASNLTVERPGWLAMLADIASLDRRVCYPVVIASAQDRLVRSLEELPRLGNLLDSLDGQLITESQGTIGIKKGGRDAYYITGVMAASEAEKIGVRTRAGMMTAAMSGKAHGVTPYGWRNVGQPLPTGRMERRDVIDSDAQAVILDAARRVLAGESIASIAARLNTAGVAAPGAGRLRDKSTGAVAADAWDSRKVRQVLMRRANIAKRTITRDGTTLEFDAAWPPLMETDTYFQVCAVLEAPERRTSLSVAAVHLLSGIARCAVCGDRVTAQKSRRGAKRKSGGDQAKYTVYRCARSHVSKSEPHVDAVVEMHVLDFLTDPTIRAQFLADGTDVTRNALEVIAGAQARQAELSAMWDAGNLSGMQFAAMNRTQLDRIAEAERILGQRRDRTVYDELLRVSAAEVEAAWVALPIDRSRAIVSALFDITLHPATARGRGSFSAETITITPKAVTS